MRKSTLKKSVEKRRREDPDLNDAVSESESESEEEVEVQPPKKNILSNSNKKIPVVKKTSSTSYFSFIKNFVSGVKSLPLVYPGLL